jgi:hypothetical protein
LLAVRLDSSSGLACAQASRSLFSLPPLTDFTRPQGGVSLVKDVNAAHEKSNEITIGIPFPVYDHQRSSTRSLRKEKKGWVGNEAA